MNKKYLPQISQENLSYAGIQNYDGMRDFQDTALPPAAESGYLGPDEVKRIVERDLLTVQNLVKAGKLNNTQGQYLADYVINKANDMVNNMNARNVCQDLVLPDGLAEFEKEKSDFFKLDGRSDVLDYLKNSGVHFDKDEISLISQIIEKLENSAVERYLKQIAREKTLNDENEIAKKRLRANAQNSNFNDVKNRVFTREQIGKMSSAEFAKNEKAIMEQLRKGLIR